MPTGLACLRRSVERMWPRRVPTRFGPATRLRRPKNQWNQGPLATQQAEMCPRTANSGQEHRRVEVFEVEGGLDPDWRPWIACAARVTCLTWRKDTRTGLW